MHDLEIIGDTTETRFNRDGTTRRVRVVRFFLGKFGPYTEEWPADEYGADKFTARVSELQLQLQMMGAR
jgi:hypothetical protein